MQLPSMQSAAPECSPGALTDLINCFRASSNSFLDSPAEKVLAVLKGVYVATTQ